MKKHSIARAVIVSLIFTCLYVLLAAFSFVVYAHPGRTDENGGHTDHSTGEYHYHHGYSAHDHYDMDGDGDKDCPYDFVDKTDHSSNTHSDTSSDTVRQPSKSNANKDSSPSLGAKIALSLVSLLFTSPILTNLIDGLVQAILTYFSIKLSDKTDSILFFCIYFIVSCFFIYLIVIW